MSATSQDNNTVNLRNKPTNNEEFEQSNQEQKKPENPEKELSFEERIKNVKFHRNRIRWLETYGENRIKSIQTNLKSTKNYQIVIAAYLGFCFYFLTSSQSQMEEFLQEKYNTTDDQLSQEVNESLDLNETERYIADLAA